MIRRSSVLHLLALHSITSNELRPTQLDLLSVESQATYTCYSRALSCVECMPGQCIRIVPFFHVFLVRNIRISPANVIHSWATFSACLRRRGWWSFSQLKRSETVRHARINLQALLESLSLPNISVYRSRVEKRAAHSLSADIGLLSLHTRKQSSLLWNQHYSCPPIQYTIS